MIYDIDTYNYNIIKTISCQKRRRGNQGRRNNTRKYKNVFCAFDIEATNDLKLKHAYMYIWQMQIDDCTIIGRTWDEWLVFLERIRNQLDDNEYLMIYVHNLSYEFSFIKGIYHFEPEEVFCTDRRKILKCEMFSHFEFRCSYLLTNMSLAVFTEKMKVTKKLSGDDFDYYKIRYPWTELSDDELAYCVTDVVSLVEALKVYFNIEHDNFYSIPLTSTGFVRRDVRAAMRHFNKNDLHNMLADYEVFCILREAFRGGNTHANRFYSGQIINNVSSYDRVSSYPDVQINDLFPMSPWIREDKPDIERVCRKIYKHKRACLMRVAFWGIRLRDPMWGCPYIPKHKCRNLTKHYNDNGRILQADYLEISLTDIDFNIIMKQYVFDYAEVIDFYHCRYGKLPRPLRDVVLKYFQDKTDLKNVSGQEVFYHMAKAKLNSIYGMTVQSPVKQTIDYVNDDFILRDDNEIDILNASNQRAFLSYAWGVWTTARAREHLEIAIENVGNNFIYCDTDSVKFIDDGSISFSSYNNQRKRTSIKNGGVAADRSGKKQYLGLYDYEETYKEFITLGAKKYAYKSQDGDIHITVAGVGKKSGAKEITKAGGLGAFCEGFIFKDAGGTESVYNDVVDPFCITRNGKELMIVSNVMIKQSTYTLGVTGEYRRLLENPTIWLDLIR